MDFESVSWVTDGRRRMTNDQCKMQNGRELNSSAILTPSQPTATEAARVSRSRPLCDDVWTDEIVKKLEL